MAAPGITEREYNGIVKSMDKLQDTVDKGFLAVNKSIAAIHKEYGPRLTKVETKVDNQLKQKILLTLLGLLAGWLMRLLF